MSARAFAPSGAPCHVDGVLELDEEETHYLQRVRRLRADEAFEVIEVDRALWRARFLDMSGRRCSVRLVERVPEPPSAPTVTLLLGLPDTRALEELIPGIVELGVARLSIVQARYSQKKSIDPQRIDRLIRSAQRQCGRYRTLTVEGTQELAAALTLAASNIRSIDAAQGNRAPPHSLPEERSEQPSEEPSDTLDGLIGAVGPGAELVERVLAGLHPRTRRVVAVGPEGGWSDEEQRMCIERGLRPCTVAPYVLRTPTAALALCTLALQASVRDR